MTEQSRLLARAIREDAILMTSRAGSAHVGSCLSVADILAVLYSSVLSTNPADPADPTRDRLIFSKGHAGAALYAALAHSGYFPPEDLLAHCADGSRLSGHVSHVGVPGVDFSTGSLGHGLPVAAGMAKAAGRLAQPFRVFAVLSDGELDEGSVWEAAMFAAHHQLSSLCAIVDYNKIQSLTSTHATLDLEPLAEKWAAFGWTVHEVDGHDHSALEAALVAPKEHPGPPVCVIAHTTKGKGVPFMEDSVLWHYRSPQGAELDAALEAVRVGGGA